MAKAAIDAVLGDIDTSLAKNTLTGTEAPPMETTALVTKLDEVAETNDLDVSTMKTD